MVTDTQFDAVVNNVQRILTDLELKISKVQSDIQSMKGDINTLKSKSSMEIHGYTGPGPY